MSSFNPKVLLQGMRRFFASRRRLRAENVRLRTEVQVLRALALTDALTGLANRRAFDETFAKEGAQALRSNKPLTVAVFDLDHFKRVNDTHGHAVGDAILRCVGEILRGFLRTSDFAARIGGEEFAILLPETNQAGAHVFIERLREEVVKKLSISTERGQVEVTASFGHAEMLVNEHRADTLRRADKALYMAKTTGRNRVSPAPPPRSRMK